MEEAELGDVEWCSGLCSTTLQILLEPLLGFTGHSAWWLQCGEYGLCWVWSAPAASWKRVENPKEESRRNDWRILCVLRLG